MTDIFQIVVVYDRPKDYPEFFIARRWELNLITLKSTPCEIMIISKDYDYVYEKLNNAGLHKINRYKKEEILETIGNIQ